MAKLKVQVTKDPENRQTIILDRWPTAEEKTNKFREEVAKVRASSLTAVEEPAVDKSEPTGRGAGTRERKRTADKKQAAADLEG